MNNRNNHFSHNHDNDDHRNTFKYPLKGNHHLLSLPIVCESVKPSSYLLQSSSCVIPFAV